MDSYDPDILAEGLEVVFCGLNPPAEAARAGHNFASATNRFWPVLHLAGFTDRCLLPTEERCLLDYRCGITTAIARPTRRAAEVSSAEFMAARPAFEAKMRSYAPHILAFLGKSALSAMTGKATIEWGEQLEPFAGALAWVLPNPSGLNRGFNLEALVQAYGVLRLSSHGITFQRR